MALPPDERRGRAKVNQAVRDWIRLGPLRPAGSEDLYGVPKATELRSLAQAGMSSREIAREIARSVDAVQARAKKARAFAETSDG